MLPEPVKLLREWVQEDYLETKKEIDEQYLEVLNRRIYEAVEHGKAITVRYFRKENTIHLPALYMHGTGWTKHCMWPAGRTAMKSGKSPSPPSPMWCRRNSAGNKGGFSLVQRSIRSASFPKYFCQKNEALWNIYAGEKVV